MTTAVTSYNVKKKALGELGVTTIGQQPEADDILRITDYYLPLIAELAALDIYYFSDPEAIPREAFLSLATCLAHASQSEFGIADQEAQKLEARKMQAEAKLRTLASLKPTYEVFKMENI